MTILRSRGTAELSVMQGLSASDAGGGDAVDGVHRLVVVAVPATRPARSRVPHRVARTVSTRNGTSPRGYGSLALTLIAAAMRVSGK